MAQLGLLEMDERDDDAYEAAAKLIGAAALPEDALERHQSDGAFLLIIGSIATLEITALSFWLF